MDYDQSKINTLLGSVEWLPDDLTYLKDAIRSGDSAKVKSKAQSFMSAFESRISNSI